MWQTISEDDFIGLIAAQHPTRKVRLEAYSRIKNNAQEMQLRKAQIIVPASSTFELLVHEFDEGFSFIDVVVKPHAKLTTSYVHNDKADVHSLVLLRVTLEEGAHYTSLSAFLGASSPGFFHETILRGEHSSTEQRTLFFGDNKQEIDIFSSTIHQAPHTKTSIWAKGVLGHEARARFDGSIEIAQTGSDSDAHLHEHTILLSPLARVNAIPALKIATNDVRASHAASVTRLDDEHMFYLTSRGISEHDAGKLIIEGFLADMYRGSNHEQALDALIQEKICRM